MKTLIITLMFIMAAMLPRTVKADTLDVQQCLNKIQSQGPFPTSVNLVGHTRMQTPCKFSMKIEKDHLSVSAEGSPLQVAFDLSPKQDPSQSIEIESCRVDKEKLHLVFEVVPNSEFSKTSQIQMTLLRRQGSGLSLILSKRENKIFRPLQQSNLICHLD